MKNLLRLLCLSLCTLFAFCSTPKYTNPVDFPEERITFGSGGGIAGFVTEYVLLKNGQLFMKKTTDEQYQALDRVDKDQVEQIFKNYEFLNIGSVQHDHPSNMYRFIQFDQKDAQHKITWGDANMPVEKNVDLLYGILNQLIKESK